MHEDTEAAFAAETLRRHGVAARLTLSTTRGTLWHGIDAPSGPLTHWRHGMQAIHRTDERGGYWHLEDFVALPLEERVESLLRSCGIELKRNGLVFDVLAEAHAALPDVDAARLKDLRLRHEWGTMANCIIDCAWTGWGDDLAIAPQHHTLDLRDPTATQVLAALVRLARVDVRRERLSADGLVLDGPLTAFLAERGRSAEDFVAAAVAAGCAISHRHAEPANHHVEFEGERIGVAFVDGRVASEFDFSPDLSWRKGCLTVRNATFPETVMGALVGRPLRDIVDHRWLGGLVVASANRSVSRKKGVCLTLMAKAA